MKFTIRDLFLVTVIVAILLAWWLDRSRLATELSDRYSAERVLDSLWPSWREGGIPETLTLPVSPAPAPKTPKR